MNAAKQTITSETETRKIYGETVFRLTSEAALRVVNAVDRHPRFEQLYTNLDSLYAWIERAQARYLAEVDRIGPTKARLQVARIVNEVALIGAAA